MKYYIIQTTGQENTLLEVMEAKSGIDARRQATRKYINIVTSNTSNLVVVTKAAYEKYYA